MNNILSLIGLYMGKEILASYEDGHTAEGLLLGLSPDMSGLLLNGETHPLEGLADLEFVAELADYHSFRRCGELKLASGNITFTEAALRDPADMEKLRYLENTCRLAGHLQLEMTGGSAAFRPSELHLLHCVRSVTAPELTQRSYLYLLDDGSAVPGQLCGAENGTLTLRRMGGIESTVEHSAVRDILRAPTMGDHIRVLLQDGSTAEGIVSMADPALVLLPTGEGGSMAYLQYPQIRTLEWLGTVALGMNGAAKKISVITGTDSNAEEWLCKPAYCFENTDYNQLVDGMEVWFVPSVNSKHRIARQVQLQEGVRPAPQHTGYGVVIYYPLDATRLGWIGNTFMTPEYRARTNRPLSKGNVSFRTEQLETPLQLENIYIVKYTCPGDPNLGRQQASTVQVVEQLRRENCCCVTVAADGSWQMATGENMPEPEPTDPIEAVRSCAARRFIGTLTRTDGSVSSVRLLGCTDTHVTLRALDAPHQPPQTIELSTITDFQPIRPDRSSSPTADLSFRLRMMAPSRPVGTLSLNDGTIAPVRLLACTETHATMRPLGVADQTVQMVPLNTIADFRARGKITTYRPEGFGYIGWVWFHANDMVPGSDAPHEGMIVSYSQKPVSKDGERKINAVEILPEQTEEKQGWLVSYDPATGRCQLRELGDEQTEAPVKKMWMLPPDPALEPLLRQCQFDGQAYRACWRMVQMGERTFAELVLLSVEETAPQRQFGYLSIWFPDKHHGFIYRPDQVDSEFRGLRNERGLYLHENDIRKNMTGKPLPSPWKYSSFAVSYDLSTTPGKRYAVNVSILYDAQAQARAEQEEPATVSLVLPTEQQIDLADFAAEGEEIGILGLCSNHSAKIFRVFESGYTPESTDDVVLFDPQSIHFSTEEYPNTAKTLYLVRYKKQGTVENTYTGQMHPTVAEGSTVTVLRTYRRAAVQRLEVSADGASLQEKYISAAPAAAPAVQVTPLSRQLSMIPPPLAGETVLLADDAGTPQQLCTGQTQPDGLYLTTPAGETLGAVNQLSSRIWRFGCITGFDADLGVGLMNDVWTFSLESAQLLLPMLKSQKNAAGNAVGLYCVFRCEAGRICEVQRLRKYWNLIQWTGGVLTAAVKEPAQILVTVDNKNLVHRTTTETYPDLKRRIKNNTHVGLPVWVRQVWMAWQGEQALQLRAEAVDLHSTEQTPVIRYVERTDSYEGYENQTEHFPVQGNRSALQAVENLPAAVVFAPAPDGTTLECRLKDETVSPPLQEQEGDETGETVSELPNAPLMQLYLHSADLSQTALRGVQLDENGMPGTPREAVRIFKLLFNQHQLYYPTNWQNQLLAARIALAFPQEIHQSPRVPTILLGVLRMKLRALSRGSDAVYGELAYGLSLLMQHDRSRKDDTDYRVWLLLQDLGTAEEVMNYETGVANGRAVSVQALCARPLPEENAGSLLAHLLLLDPVGMEQLCPLLEANEPLKKAACEYAASVSDEARRAPNLADMLRVLRSAAARDRQSFAASLGELCSRQSDICDDVARLVGIMGRRWLKLACRDDRERFARLQAACESAANYLKLGGFTRQEQELTNAWRTLDSLEKECLAHPCRETTELLVLGPHLDDGITVFARLKSEVAERLNRLYGRDSLPSPVCELNEESLSLDRFRGGEADVQLIVRNGDSRNMLQTAENPVIRLESLTPGIQVTPEIRLEHKLAVGESTAVILNLTVDDEESLAATDRVLIEWQAEFLYTAAFKDGRAVQSTGATGSSAEPLVLQLVSEQHEFKDPTAHNPYREAAKGNPLKENAKVYCHRAEEDTILNSILTDDPDGGKTFRPGATVILHGQKKSGKTSLINQVKAYIDRSETLRDRALIIDFDSMLSNVGGVSKLSNFLLLFCSAILDQFATQVKKHRDLRLLMRENGLQIPDVLEDHVTAYARFSRFFTQFNELDEGRHTVLLFMDEFTTLCTTLLTEIENAKACGDTARENYLQHIPDFIKDFSGKGFIQVVIGHEAMMRSLNTLGMLNQTAEFATTVELTALRPSEAERLIREPMVQTFGYDPYRTALGADAVEYLKDITGCHPTFLVRACMEVFDYYLDESRFSATKTQLTRRDVVSAMNRYITELSLENFDILMVEDGDGVESPEQRKTYRYLKCAAEKALTSYDRRTADSREVADAMHDRLGTAEAERVRNILEARRVIRFTEGGRLRIETGLFLEYIRQRNGGKQ